MSLDRPAASTSEAWASSGRWILQKSPRHCPQEGGICVCVHVGLCTRVCVCGGAFRPPGCPGWGPLPAQAGVMIE